MEKGSARTDAGTTGLRQASTTLAIATEGPGFTDLTADVRRWLKGLRAANGLLTAYCRHTSASLVIQENADADVRRDLLRLRRTRDH